jgi:hypothetical protein
MEAGAVAGQKVLTSGGRSLKPEEKRLLLSIFGNSINMEPVQIVSTSVGAAGRPYTLGNTIRVPDGTTFDAETLVHEMTHVWQYQTRGTAYISDSVVHQLGPGDAYATNVVPGQSFYDYTAEQEATIVQRYYADASWKTNPDVARMMGEVRKARPLSSADIQKDLWFGPGKMPDTGATAGGDKRPAETVPLIRIEF